MPLTALTRQSRSLGVRLAGAALAVCAVAGLAGCSAVGVAYNQSPTLVYWWLDGYVDVSSAQAPAVRNAVAATLSWHRRQRLPDVIDKLDRLKDEALRDATPERTCAWWRTTQEQIDTVLEQVAPKVAELGATMEPAQFRHLERKFRERDDTWRKEHMQADPAERDRQQLERVTDRAEKVYGRLSKEQSAWLGEQLRRSPWDPQRWLQDRQTHQRQVLDGLKQLAAARANVPGSPASASADPAGFTRDWLLRAAHPEGPDLDALIKHQCSLMADFHNRTTPTQRQHASDVMAGWAREARGLVAEGR